MFKTKKLVSLSVYLVSESIKKRLNFLCMDTIRKDKEKKKTKENMRKNSKKASSSFSLK